MLLVAALSVDWKALGSVFWDSAPIALGILIFVITVATDTIRRTRQATASAAKIKKIEEVAEKQPEKVKFAWDVARIKLEEYFDRNLTQVKWIFIASILVMAVGFAFISYGVMLAFKESIKASLVAACSGILTEFIGATFMAIYRSTLKEAGEFMSVLERINTVGMAVQILDSIPENETQLKNKTRAEIVNLLLSVRVARKKVEE